METNKETNTSLPLLEILRCPLHPKGNVLQIVDFQASSKNDAYGPCGTLRCSECMRDFSMVDGIVDMVILGSNAGYIASESQQWDNYAPQYDEKRAHEEIYLAGVEAAAQELAVEDNELILEGGCGTGMVLRRYFRPSIRVVALDLSLKSLQWLQRASPGPGVDLVRASVDRLPFCDGAFDRVLCANTLQHLPSDKLCRRALREFARVGRARARIVVSVYNWSMPKRKAGGHKEGPTGGLSGRVQHTHFFERNEFQQLLETSLKVESIRGAGFPFPYRFKLSPLSRRLERVTRKLRLGIPWANMLIGAGYAREQFGADPLDGLP
jgi:uncharacterized protein YbaR (Trm112 family)